MVIDIPRKEQPLKKAVVPEDYDDDVGTPEWGLEIVGYIFLAVIAVCLMLTIGGIWYFWPQIWPQIIQTSTWIISDNSNAIALLFAFLVVGVIWSFKVYLEAAGFLERRSLPEPETEDQKK